MNKTKQTIAAILAVAVVGIGGFFVYDATKDDQPVETSNTQTVEQTTEQTKPEISFSEDGTNVSYSGETGKTALELLEEGTDVTTESSDFGDFVTGINGIQADSSKEYWSFYVNGGYASEGAGTYQTTDGEMIEWKLEQL